MKNYREIFAGLNTPQSRNLFFQAIGISLGVVLTWVIFAAILSLFRFWIIIILAMVLTGIWLYRLWQEKQRQLRIDSGYCSQCGYDLRATPEICPECGRDAGLDEPTWKKVRRNFVKAKQSTPALTVAGAAPTTAAPPAMKKIVLRRREAVDDEPIPLEPLPTDFNEGAN